LRHRLTKLALLSSGYETLVLPIDLVEERLGRSIIVVARPKQRRAQELGKTSVMTEEHTTGGTCGNRGCCCQKTSFTRWSD
jgi:hypothetical protein